MILGLLLTSTSQIIRGPEPVLIWSFVCGELGHSSNKRYFLYIAMVISFSVSMSLEGP